jgi:hypothetical protein
MGDEATDLALAAAKSETGLAALEWMAKIAIAGRRQIAVVEDMESAWLEATLEERRAAFDDLVQSWTAKCVEAAQKALEGHALIGCHVEPDPDTVAMYAVGSLGDPRIVPDPD